MLLHRAAPCNHRSAAGAPSLGAAHAPRACVHALRAVQRPICLSSAPRANAATAGWRGAVRRRGNPRCASYAASDVPVTSGSRRPTSRTGGCVVSREPARKVRVEVTPRAQHAARSPHCPCGPARRVPGVLHDRGAAHSARPAHRRCRGSPKPTKRSPCGPKGHSRCADVKVPMVTGMGGSAAAGAPRGRRHGARTRSRSRRHGRHGPEVCARYGHAARGCGPWPVACEGPALLRRPGAKRGTPRAAACCRAAHAAVLRAPVPCQQAFRPPPPHYGSHVSPLALETSL